MKIDSELCAFIPVLSKSERAVLEASIVREGCRDALVVWAEKDILLDGHHRLEICKRLGKPYKTIEISLPDREAAKDWMATNVLGRRNLTKEQFDFYVGWRYNHAKQSHGGDRRSEQSRAQNELLKSAERVAAVVGVSPATVKRDAKFAEEVVDDPELFEAVKTGGSAKTVKRKRKEKSREKRRQENAAQAQKTPDVLSAGARFATILADPPWDWGDEGDVNQMGRAKPDYATMPIEKLMALPVAKLADDDCHLYLWITNRSMPKGFRVLEAWGFRFVTILTWPKSSFGMGNYFRGQTEHVLFGVRGSQALKRKDASTLLPIWARGKGHSTKPVEFYEFVESCSPGPYLELFARAKRGGWSAWGADSR